MGVVYLGEQQYPARNVALKRLKIRMERNSNRKDSPYLLHLRICLRFVQEILPKYRRENEKPKSKKLSKKDGNKSRHVARAQLLLHGLDL